MDERVSVDAWHDADAGFDSYCVSVVVGVDPAEVVEAFAADRESYRMATFAEQREMSTPYPDGYGNDTVQIDVLDAGVVCVEANGWAGVSEPRACLLSQRGCFVSAYRSVNADMQLIYAVGGKIVRSFDPLLYDSSAALQEEVGLPFGHPGSPSAAALTLIERLTGVRLTRAWLLEQAHPAYRRDPEV